MEMLYHSVNDLIRLANEYQIPLWKVVLLADVQERQVTVEESFETMRQMYQAMRQADQGYDGSIVSASGMAGGDGEKLHAYNASGRSLAGGYMGLVMEKAVKMGESNACMKRIVAAPTAGACGVIPAVFLSYEEYCKETENRMVEALFVSAGIGAVIAENASIAGASGGCQAEIGSASAMAAGGLAYLQGGDGAFSVSYTDTYAVTSLTLDGGRLTYVYDMPDNPPGTDHDGHIDTQEIFTIGES